MQIPMQAKALAFGEVHGINGLPDLKIGLIRSWLDQNQSVCLLLERGVDQQSAIENWMRDGHPTNSFLQRFINPNTSLFFETEYNFLDSLAKLHLSYPGQLQVFCVDIAFDDSDDTTSKSILSEGDEDLFDQRREQFIIEEMQTHERTLSASQKIMWIAGNMHASKTAHYFPLDEVSVSHILTSSMWLHERFGLESIYTLAFSGQARYQSEAGLALHPLSPSSLEFQHLTAFQGFRPTHSLPGLSPEFRNSYDWILGIPDAQPANNVEMQLRLISLIRI